MLEDAVGYQPPDGLLRLTVPMMQGPRVLQLQKALFKAGFDVGEFDQVFGPQTEAMVIAFQAREGLVADGEVGPETAAALGF
jgi:peptidoglycan hydrolase-like protein with peptidoglycan-binding domain